MQQADEHVQHEQNFAQAAPQAQVVSYSVDCPATADLPLVLLQLKRTIWEQSKYMIED